MGSASRESGDERDAGGAGGEGGSSPGESRRLERQRRGRLGPSPNPEDKSPRQGVVVLPRVGRR